jgi:hypothetical protein
VRNLFLFLYFRDYVSNLLSISINVAIPNTSEIKETNIKIVQNSQIFLNLNKIDNTFNSVTNLLLVNTVYSELLNFALKQVLLWVIFTPSKPDTPSCRMTIEKLIVP